MAYQQDKAPVPHYVVSVQVKEVVPAHGVGNSHQERRVEDVVSVTISGKTKSGALESSITHLGHEYNDATAQEKGVVKE
jgi:hypothetical protein